MKVLIISHNPISTINNNGKTMLAMFSEFKKEELCQLYIYPSLPDTNTCSSYFRVTDKDIIKSYFKFKVQGKVIGEELIDETNHAVFEKVSDERLYRNPKNKNPFRMLLRDLAWKFAGWYNKQLKIWLEEQKPTHIYVAPGNAKFLYDIALKISKKWNLPIITYICDDYYFVKPSTTCLGKIQRKLLQNKIEKLMKNTSQVITICDELKECYEEKFAVSSQTVMTGGSYKIAETVKTKKEISSITFLGNVRCNRYVSLAEIGKTLDQINEEYKTTYRLDIYTSENDENILNTLKDIAAIRLCGFVAGEEFTKTFFNADCLLHVEAFDEESQDLVKRSISTKIADSLGSGITMFAYGPSAVASMRHLIDNDCAIVCTEQEQLKLKLLTLLMDEKERERVAENGIAVAKEYHMQEKNSRIVYQLMGRIDR